MENKGSKKGIVIAIIAVLSLAVLFFAFWERKETPSGGLEKGTSEISEEQNTEENKESVAKTATGKENAYDYILSVMNKPQFWSSEEYQPLYSAPWLKEEADKALVNGTGWTLVDEKSATFRRGYEGSLTISFSDHTAVSEDTVSGLTYYLDYKNHEYYYELNGQKTRIDIHNDIAGFYDTDLGILEKTFTYYDEIFSMAGCPLLEKPQGTLASYKKKTINPVAAAGDGLIHAVWEEENFSFNWESAENLSWLSDYKDISAAKTPESSPEVTTYEHIDGSVETISVYSFSPVYLVLADKESSLRYQKEGNWFEGDAVFDNITESLATYYLKPAMEKVYGYNAVYFTDCHKVSGPSRPQAMSSKEEFDKGFSYDYESLSQPIYEIFPKGDMFVGICYSHSLDLSSFQSLFGSVRRIYDYYGKEYPYGDDYLGNFMLVYSIESQKMLGLR